MNAEDDKKSLPQGLRNASNLRRPPVPKEKLRRYSRGEGLDGSGVKVNLLKKKLQKREKIVEYATEQAARLEMLLPEDAG